MKRLMMMKTMMSRLNHTSVMMPMTGRMSNFDSEGLNDFAVDTGYQLQMPRSHLDSWMWK